MSVYRRQWVHLLWDGMTEGRGTKEVSEREQPTRAGFPLEAPWLLRA